MKDKSIGLIRLIATIMIVVLHMDDFLRIFGKNPYANFFLDAGVGIFFAISGYLYGQKTIENIKKWYIDTYFKIVFPTFLFTSVAALINYAFNIGSADPLSVLASLFGFQYVIENNVSGCYHLWFITYIFACYAIIPLLQKIDFSGTAKTLRFVGNLALFAVITLVLCSFKVIGLSAYYPLEFVLFYMISRREILHGIKDIRWLKILVAAVGTVFAVIWCIYTYKGFANLPFGSTLHNLQAQFEVVWSAALFIIVYSALNALNGKKNADYPKVLSFSDRFSFGIYVINYFILYHFGKMTFMTLPIPFWIGVVLTFVQIIILGVILSYIYEFIKKSCNQVAERNREKKRHGNWEK